MSFDTWCSNEYLNITGRPLDEINREIFRDWLIKNGFSLTLYRRKEEWWELWFDYLKDTK